MEVTVTVMIYSFVIVTFSSSHGGSPFYESLMVGVRVHSLLSTPHELSQTNTSGIAMSLHASFSLLFSHDSLSAGPPGLPLQLVSEREGSRVRTLAEAQIPRRLWDVRSPPRLASCE